MEVPDGSKLLLTLEHDLLWKSAVIDLVVADIRMPAYSGIEILERLRAKQVAIPVFLMTAFGDADTRRHALMLGALLFDKPFPMAALRSAVLGLLQAED